MDVLVRFSPKRNPLKLRGLKFREFLSGSAKVFPELPSLSQGKVFLWM